MTTKHKEILCLSGGLDSFIAWHYLGKPPTVYFYTKQVHSDKEWACIWNITKGKDTIFDTSLDFSLTRDIYIPHRNLLFASRASAYADKIWIAGTKDDMVEDKTPSAFALMGACLSAIGKDNGVVVDSPFWDMTKTDVCEWYIKHVYEYNRYRAEDSLNKESISCYAGGTKPCYKCESCFRKACAMFNAGMDCIFLNTAMVIDYDQKALLGKYITERNDDIIRYSEWYKHSHKIEWNEVTLRNYNEK